jgi:hypothetical protein
LSVLNDQTYLRDEVVQSALQLQQESIGVGLYDRTEKLGYHAVIEFQLVLLRRGFSPVSGGGLKEGYILDTSKPCHVPGRFGSECLDRAAVK